MSFSALQNTPIQVDLLVACNTTGWSVDGVLATHDSCVTGSIILFNYPTIAGNTYQISWICTVITSGSVQAQSPGSNGTSRTVAGLFVETLNPTADGFISFFSNGNCTITAFNVTPVSTAPGLTIVYSATNSAKRGLAIWSDFRSFYADFGWSLYTRTIVASQGDLYTFDNGTSSDTNNFFGTPFQSSIKIVEAKNPEIVKDFETLTYQANQLLTTTQDGIETSMGQISTLIDTDFIKQNLVDDDLVVTLYQNDGVYSASFLGDEGDQNIVNGNGLRGNFVIVELITNDGSTPLTLFSISIRSKVVSLGSRPL